MKAILLVFGMMYSLCANGQFRNDIWVFGDSAGINFINKINPITFISGIKSRGSCVSICDKNNNLMFYADTKAGFPGPNSAFVYDNSNTYMQNGTNILGQGWYYELVIIPFPNDTNKYYLFSIGVSNSSPYGLYYSIIDMTLNNGLGAVTQKNIQVNNMKANDGLTAIKQGNGRDWWLIFRNWGGAANNTFYKYLIDVNGINLPDTQQIGTVVNSGWQRFKFNKKGDTLAVANYNGLIEFWTFDRCTGLFSNHTLIHPKINTSPPTEFWSCEFSPNGRFLYIATSGYYYAAYLIQVDLLNPLLYAAADTIDSIYVVSTPGGALNRGPDDKIYWSCAYYDGFNFNYPYPDTLYNTYNTYLSVINEPDSLGAACNFTPYSFYLGGARTYWGLPNNPDYDLGPLVGSPCDTLSADLTPGPSPKERGEIQCTYITSWEKLFVNAQHVKGRDVAVSVYDGRGSAIKNYELKIINGYATVDVDCSGWSDGLYIVHLQTEQEILSTKFVKE